MKFGKIIRPNLMDLGRLFYTIQTLRKIDCSNAEIDWALELGEKFQREEVTNLLSWLVFDKLVKHANKLDL
ncbi:MAG: hypothetical protein U0T80_03670 [Flavobacteriaceae bacterium]